MAQILDPIPTDRSDRHIVCCYVNATSKIQIARITNIQNWYFERVVFPGQRLVFESFAEGLLEIHTGMMASAILSDKIPCNRLRISEQKSAGVDLGGEIKEEAINIIKTGVEAIAKNRPISRPMRAAALTTVD
ncbi:DUF1830 domain-containing protein [Ancylothrix sp. C2]|uniref:DUF1830 domain-containing protein n=1 Tax=Ancylothrix sp. D3o TaxID=2953691 RepID=UPI0021BB9B3B|nr:DUF1830 domain-containing protein [Ancylothrix sp. D3o]MCT7949957.1 DUF1830 domain-containing protein [Ancylothrix sp. D3o]